VKLPCSHIYHGDCLLRWYETGKANDGACPICRRSFILARATAEEEAPTDEGHPAPAETAVIVVEMEAQAPATATGTSFTANVRARLPTQPVLHSGGEMERRPLGCRHVRHRPTPWR
jgi:hypothetical protein